MNILNEYETIEKLKNGYSIARFGDGEFFNIIQNRKPINKMQEYDNLLREKLLSIFDDPLDDLLIGIPRMDKPNKWVSNFHKEFSKFIINKNVYNKSIFASAFISRPHMIGISNSEYFEELKSIWYERYVVIVNFNERIILHELFDNCYVKYIKIERKNCFSDYEFILDKCSKYFKEDVLFLISAGPTATCLAYDICKNIEQVIDIGQIVFEHLISKHIFDKLEDWTSQNSYRRDKYK